MSLRGDRKHVIFMLPIGEAISSVSEYYEIASSDRRKNTADPPRNGKKDYL
jgi:hypothetical protein